jgi:hypothetical protein
VASIPPARCPACRKFVRRRADVDDHQAEEAAYHVELDQLDAHECSALEETGDTGPHATRALRRERPRMTTSKQRARLRKHVCSCQPPRILRAATTDLTDLVCPRCETWFTWSPTDSELNDDELAGRIPA